MVSSAWNTRVRRTTRLRAYGPCAIVAKPSLDKQPRCGFDQRMIRKFNPPSLVAPISPYSHGVSIPAGMRIVTTAGQVGITKDGVIPPTVEEQLFIAS